MIPFTLFDVYSIHNPNDDPRKIGEIVLTSELYRSVFGDELLFFRHERYRRDLAKLRDSDDASENDRRTIFKAEMSIRSGND